ncbi:MAG: ribosomal protein L7/L12 [Planctomycetaceae bacterium]|jgi:hypothetical protein|nr:ribosomal protein L7/L12 [Planctomycetaceae bacterium]
MSADISPEVKTQIADAIFAQRKIEAIKLYRDASGQGLKEAKDFIESLTTELQEKSPEKFTSGSASASGCGSSAVLLISVVGAIGYWIA